MYLNHKDFTSGDVTTNSPVLIAELSDESGINMVGNGIGHDIVAYLDNSTNPVTLNPYYVPEVYSYTKGTITYPLGQVEDGHHTLTLKVWDVYNNSSSATIDFLVDYNVPISLTKVFNYPNPFRDVTNFYFEHDKPGQELDVNIYIYDITGKQMTMLYSAFNTEYLHSEPIVWDGRNEAGEPLTSGVYLYRIVVRSESGHVQEQNNKLLLIR
jgi:hypothetical protein